EPPLFRPDALEQRLHLRFLQMIDLHRDTGSAELRDQFSRFLNRLRAIGGDEGALRLARRNHLAAGAAPGAVDCRPGLTEHRSDTASCAARCPGNDGYLASQWFHGELSPSNIRQINSTM